MSAEKLPHPISFVAERAVRYLRERGEPVDSLTMVDDLLATKAGDERAAQNVLKAAFAGDSRLAYRKGHWNLTQPLAPEKQPVEPDRTLLLIQGEPPEKGKPFRLSGISALRLHQDEVLAACGGETTHGAGAGRLRRAMLEILDGAVPVIHDPPGSLKAVERWLQESLAAPISVRRLAQERIGMPAAHDLESLVARLGLEWRETDDPLEQADTLDACLRALQQPGERLQALRTAATKGARPLDWSRYAFNREFLRRVPRVPGVYRFFDHDNALLYVGKSKDLNRRLSSYFRDEVRVRTPRVQKLLDSLHRIEFEASGSDLEAMLREAEQIRRERPQKNIQRNVHARKSRAERLQSILILEPAAAPAILRAFLIHRGQFIDRVDIGPRGGGLTRIQRVLDDYFFYTPEGPTVVSGPDLDVELVVRWLATNRDKVVAFDPTDLKTSHEVIERLRWFLDSGSLFDPDGAPVIRR